MRLILTVHESNRESMMDDKLGPLRADDVNATNGSVCQLNKTASCDSGPDRTNHCRPRQSATRRTGRRGDPRMNNAVIMRLNNPALTLYEALRLGGFDGYQDDEDMNAVDSENVTLVQRKNQLSRRLRRAKQAQKGQEQPMLQQQQIRKIGRQSIQKKVSQQQLEDIQPKTDLPSVVTLNQMPPLLQKERCAGSENGLLSLLQEDMFTETFFNQEETSNPEQNMNKSTLLTNTHPQYEASVTVPSTPSFSNLKYNPFQKHQEQRQDIHLPQMSCATNNVNDALVNDGVWQTILQDLNSKAQESNNNYGGLQLQQTQFQYNAGGNNNCSFSIEPQIHNLTAAGESIIKNGGHDCFGNNAVQVIDVEHHQERPEQLAPDARKSTDVVQVVVDPNNNHHPDMSQQEQPPLMLLSTSTRDLLTDRFLDDKGNTTTLSSDTAFGILEPESGTPGETTASTKTASTKPNAFPVTADTIGYHQSSPSICSAIQSLSHTASKAGLTLEQLAVGLENNSSILTQTLNISNLGMNSSSSSSSERERLAVSLYQSENPALYAQAMLLSGFSIDEIFSTAVTTTNTDNGQQEQRVMSQQYIEFAFKCWHAEGNRLLEQFQSKSTYNKV